MENKNKTLFIVVGVLLVIVVGISFAYFLTSNIFTGTGASTSLNTNNGLKVEYDAGTGKLESNNLVPSNILSKEFKIVVTPTKDINEVTYRIYMNITNNTFTKCNDSNYDEFSNNCEKDAEEIVYRLKDNTGNIIKEGDLTDSVTGEIDLAIITKNVTVKTEYNYILEIEYKETNKDQNHNKNATINGEVKVEFAEPDTAKPIITNVETSVTKTEISITVTATDDKKVTEYYYQIDSETPIKKTINTHTFNNLEAGSTHTIKIYVEDSSNNQSETTTKEVKTTPNGQTVDDIIAVNNPKTETPNFANTATSDEGVYSVSDPMYGGTSYYWRGAVTNNYVKFADKCWRIVRINGDKTMRLIYDGATCHANGTSTTENIAIASQTYNPSYDRSEYVGWTYSIGSQRTTSGSASNIKTQTDSWFTSNITGTNAEKVADGKFCNDRNTASGSIWSSQPNSTFYYAAYGRLVSAKAPTLACSSGDVYTMKAGAITADELVYAGGVNGSANNSYYLYNGQYYWTMSPFCWDYYSSSNRYTNAFSVHENGSIYSGSMNSIWGVRPVINLKVDTLFKVGGIGTQSNPYEVLD